MTKNQVQKLAQKGHWKGQPLQGRLLETHISWVILADDFVFKIKKPVQFSFLDFSTLERRKHFCEREVVLNQRLTNIYLEVVAIGQNGGSLQIDEKVDNPIGYAVRMKKVDSELEMDNMLEADRVSEGHIAQLAKQIAKFHASAKIVEEPFDVGRMKEDFNDLTSVKEKANQLELPYAELIEIAITASNHFLDDHRDFIEYRALQGFRRDLHGDFHSGNIFLTDPPIVFDCIEFNDEMRQVDILDEIGFFSMDLEANGQIELSDLFLKEYQKCSDLNFSEKDHRLLNYYKMYRANVRAKVELLKDEPDFTTAEKYLSEIQRYVNRLC